MTKVWPSSATKQRRNSSSCGICCMFGFAHASRPVGTRHCRKFAWVRPGFGGRRSGGVPVRGTRPARHPPGWPPTLQKVRGDAPGLRVDELRVGLQVRAELLLELAVAKEVLGGRVVDLQERPDLRVGEL